MTETQFSDAIAQVETADPKRTATVDGAVDVRPEAEYEFVKLPSGQIVAVPKSEIHAVPATATQDIPATRYVPLPEAHFYVHLANGTVLRVRETDLPAHAGADAQHGHWRQGNKLHKIIGVYPVEFEMKEGN